MTQHYSIELKELKSVYRRVGKVDYSETNQMALHELRNALRDLVFCGEIVLWLRESLKQSSIETMQSVLDEDLENLERGQMDVPIDVSKGKRGEHTGHLDHYATGIKSLFYFGRSLQDAVYRIVLEAHGQQVSPRSTMSGILRDFKSNNPVQQLLIDEFPEYILWFKDFKEKRDYIKRGAPTAPSLVFSTGAHFSETIHFLFAPLGKTDVDINYLGAVVEISRKVIEIALNHAHSRGLITGWTDLKAV